MAWPFPLGPAGQWIQDVNYMNGADGPDEAVMAGVAGEDAGEIDSFETRVLEVAQEAHGLRPGRGAGPGSGDAGA